MQFTLITLLALVALSNAAPLSDKKQSTKCKSKHLPAVYPILPIPIPIPTSIPVQDQKYTPQQSTSLLPLAAQANFPLVPQQQAKISPALQSQPNKSQQNIQLPAILPLPKQYPSNLPLPKQYPSEPATAGQYSNQPLQPATASKEYQVKPVIGPDSKVIPQSNSVIQNSYPILPAVPGGDYSTKPANISKQYPISSIIPKIPAKSNSILQSNPVILPVFKAYDVNANKVPTAVAQYYQTTISVEMSVTSQTISIQTPTSTLTLSKYTGVPTPAILFAVQPQTKLLTTTTCLGTKPTQAPKLY